MNQDKMESSWLSQAIEAAPTTNGPQGDYYVGRQTHTGKPVWA